MYYKALQYTILNFYKLHLTTLYLTSLHLRFPDCHQIPVDFNPTQPLLLHLSNKKKLFWLFYLWRL